jgi:hypothetical protein
MTKITSSEQKGLMHDGKSNFYWRVCTTQLDKQKRKLLVKYCWWVCTTQLDKQKRKLLVKYCWWV